MSPPLGLPVGSVRSILAVGALASAAYMWVSGTPMSDFQETIVTVSVTYYFASRATDPPPDPPPAIVDLDAADILNRRRGIKA